MLGDKRRSERVLKLAGVIALRPGASIPLLFDREYDMVAAYDLFSRKEVTADALQACHRAQVNGMLSEKGREFLLVEDTTTFSFSGGVHREGLGPVSTGKAHQQGYFAHSVLALERSVNGHCRVVGLADQQLFVRKPRPPGEGRNDKWKRSQRWCESHLWSDATRRLGQAPQGVRWCRVADREADVLPFLRSCHKYGHGYVVRLYQKRGLAGEHAGLDVLSYARSGQAKGHFTLHLRSRAGKPARDATLSVWAVRTCLRGPWRRNGTSEDFPCTVIRVWEENPPEGQEGLEWLLLTDKVVETAQDAIDVAQIYSCRWMIEEFHKILKSGMGAERLQLEEAKRLMAATALLSVVAARVLALREQTRINQQAPASKAGLSQV